LFGIATATRRLRGSFDGRRGLEQLFDLGHERINTALGTTSLEVVKNKLLPLSQNWSPIKCLALM
jgi:hypothetical protein